MIDALESNVPAYFVPHGEVLMPTDTTLVIRCPHCFVGAEFRPMIAYKDGRFVCRDCAHTVRPGAPEYRCICFLCLRIGRGNKGRGVEAAHFSRKGVKKIYLIH
jgi:uncharacterized protein (DUF983 family)